MKLLKILVLSLALVSCSPEEPEPDITMGFIGNSLTDQMLPYLETELEARGVLAEITKDILWASTLDQHDTDALIAIVSAGYDVVVLQGVQAIGEESYVSNLSDLIQASRAYGSEVWIYQGWGMCATMDAYYASLDIHELISVEFDVPLVRAAEAVQHDYCIDYIHLTPEGYTIVADVFVDAINDWVGVN